MKTSYLGGWARYGLLGLLAGALLGGSPGCSQALPERDAQRVTQLADSVRVRDSLRAQAYLDSLRQTRDSLARLVSTPPEEPTGRP